MRHFLIAGFLVSITANGLAAELSLIATVRDFKRGDVAGGHPDFQTFVGVDPGIVEETLGIDRKPVYAGSPSTLTTTGQTEFDQWYRDVEDVNQRLNIELVLEDQFNNGNYLFSESPFFPIDGILFGNEGENNNFHFTLELHAKFIYEDPEQYVYVESDDDIWVFINDTLVIDLGGVREEESGSVLLGDLDLTLEEEYELEIFCAERHTPDSSLEIQTNLQLERPLEGDYNENGVVDAADYTIWRDHLGQSFQLVNEGTGVTPGIVTSEDYDFWKDNFGMTGGSGSLAGVVVPEPGNSVLLFAAVLACYHCRNGRRSIRPAMES